MKAKVFCMASSKGGSGKTILTITIGTFLNDLGKKVLLIDTDAATNGLTLLHLKEVRVQGEYAIGEQRRPRGVYEDISETTPPEVVMLKSGPHLIPACYDFINTEGVSLEAYRRSLQSILSLMRESYDYIFLDAQAGSDLFAQTAMSRSISDEVIIVSEYDPMSAAGVERLKGLMREDLTYGRTWVLLNKMLPDFVQSFSDFLEIAKYLSPVPWDADVVRAYARRKLALDLENGNDYTLAILQTIKGLLDEDISKELKAWTEKRSAIIRQPILDQYSDTEKELDTLNHQRIKLLHTIERRRSVIPLAQFATFFVSEIIFSGLLYSSSFFSSTSFNLAFALFVGTAISIWVTYVAGDAISGYLFGTSSTEKSIEMKQIEMDRQQKGLQEKLRKLEFLKDADLEILIKNNIKKNYTP
jgi:cellulose biosynthesis protein BcsQ